jgi:hypothetical protein
MTSIILQWFVVWPMVWSQTLTVLYVTLVVGRLLLVGSRRPSWSLSPRTTNSERTGCAVHPNWESNSAGVVPRSGVVLDDKKLWSAIHWPPACSLRSAKPKKSVDSGLSVECSGLDLDRIIGGAHSSAICQCASMTNDARASHAGRSICLFLCRLSSRTCPLDLFVFGFSQRRHHRAPVRVLSGSVFSPVACGGLSKLGATR